MEENKLKTKQESPLVTNYKDLVQKAEVVLSEPYFKQLQKLSDRFERAKVLRETRYKYFDKLTYTEDYITNENLKNTLISPKLNSTEVPINTGTSERKLDAIKNELLSMNLLTEIRANDEDDYEIQDLGDDMNDVVTRTNQIEKDEDMWEEAIDELLSQRVVYVRELYTTETLKRGKVRRSLAKKELLSGLKVFPGSWTIPAYKWDTQPYVFVYEEVSYEEAKAKFGHLPNFEHVQPNAKTREEYLGGAFSYTFGEVQDGRCIITYYESLPDDECQVNINGVPMYEPGTELKHRYDKYSIRAYSLKSMSRDFLGGRPFTAMAKSIQSINNEAIRLIFRKFQQALEPPLAIKSGKILSKNIWDPGTYTNGLKKSDYEKLIERDEGVSNGEYQMLNLIENKIEEFIGTPNVAQGITGGREMSATEVLSLQKSFIKQLGYVVLALMRMKRDLTEIRIYNVFENYLNPIKRKVDPISKEVQEIYRTFSLSDTMLSNGRKGRKIIKFADRDLSPEEQSDLKKYEDDYEEKTGTPLRMRFVNAKKIKQFPIFWHVIVSSQDKEGTSLDKLTFQDKMNQTAAIMKITGKQPNADVIVEDFERKWKAKDWFNIQPDQEQQNLNADPNEQGKAQDLLSKINSFEATNSLGSQVSRGLRGGEQSANRATAATEAMS